MNREEWKRHVLASLKIRDEALLDVAKKIGYSYSYVAKVVYSGMRSARVEKYLSDYLGLAYPDDIFSHPSDLTLGEVYAS